MFDICPTGYKCKCGGVIDHYMDENDINNVYYKCRHCGAKYFNINELK